MVIINYLFIFGLLKRVRYQNKGYDLLSVNIEMGVMLGLPIMLNITNINLRCNLISKQSRSSMVIINYLFIFGLLKRVWYQNKGYDLLSVNIKMGSC